MRVIAEDTAKSKPPLQPQINLRMTKSNSSSYVLFKPRITRQLRMPLKRALFIALRFSALLLLYRLDMTVHMSLLLFAGFQPLT